MYPIQFCMTHTIFKFSYNFLERSSLDVLVSYIDYDPCMFICSLFIRATKSDIETLVLFRYN